MKAHVLSGIDRIDTIAPLLKGKRIGLMTNPTGIDHSYRSTIDIVAERFRLTALFAVEHGIRGELQNGQAFDTWSMQQLAFPFTVFMESTPI